jgi:hypothetical protein
VVGAQSSVGCACDRFKTALRISAGRRFWVIGHCRLVVQIRLRVSARIAQPGRATVLSKSLLARFMAVRSTLMGRSCGLSRVIGSSPVAGSICRPSSMVEQPPHVCGVNSTASLAHLPISCGPNSVGYLVC